MRAQLDAEPSTAGERFAVATGKIEACSKLRTRKFQRKTGIGGYFLEKIKE